MQKVYEGVPEAFGQSITAYITVTGQELIDQRNGILRDNSSYFIGLGYKVAGAEKDAERKLAAGLADFIDKYYVYRRSKVGDYRLHINMSLANAPEYQLVAGTEYRVYPILITAVLEESTP